MTKRRLVKVTAVGYFEIWEESLAGAYEASTFEEAVAHQIKWYDEDPESPFQDFVDGEFPSTMNFELMPEGFEPEA